MNRPAKFLSLCGRMMGKTNRKAMFHKKGATCLKGTFFMKFYTTSSVSGKNTVQFFHVWLLCFTQCCCLPSFNIKVLSDITVPGAGQIFIAYDLIPLQLNTTKVLQRPIRVDSIYKSVHRLPEDNSKIVAQCLPSHQTKVCIPCHQRCIQVQELILPVFQMEWPGIIDRHLLIKKIVPVDNLGSWRIILFDTLAVEFVCLKIARFLLF